MTIKIAIIGTGNMGKRHLEACGKLPQELEAVCYDSNREMLDSVSDFCEANKIKLNKLILANSMTELLEFISEKTIVIVATTARDRQKILSLVIARQPLAIITEKPLTQTLAEYESLIELAKEKKVPVYINFTRHLYAFYQEIKEQLEGLKAVSMRVVFPNGIALIGIHMFELMTWLLNVNECKIVESKLHKTFQTKRKDYVDMYGEIAVEISNGMCCTFSSCENSNVFSIEIDSERNRFRIFESENRMEIADKYGSIEQKRLEIPYTSQIMDIAIADLLKSGRTRKLPDIFEAFLAHKMLFNYLNNHKLTGMNIT